ncbi:MAG: TRAP transporter small permease [Methylocystaceae bacterium]
MKAVERFEKALTNIEYWVAVPIFSVMLAIMVLQVVFRYFLHMPLSWSEELARYLFVASTFMGAAIATREREHVEINFTELMITSWVKGLAQQMKFGIIANVFRDVVTIVFLTLVTNETYKLVVDQFNMGQVSTAMQFPIWIVTSTMFVGLALCIVHSVLLIILNLGGRGKMGYEFAEEANK